MKFINTTPVTDAILISSSVAENDYAAWSGASTYAPGDRVIVTTGAHKIYESAQAANTNHNPVGDDGTWWFEVTATNRWKMFDQGVGTQTEAADEIVVVLEPGLCNALALLDVAGNSARIQVVAESVTIFDETYSIGDSTILGDWFEYFFEDISQTSNLNVVGLPVFGGGQITVTISAPVTARCGTLAVGRMIDIGKTRAGARVGIIDYSRKETDQWGNTTVVERAYARRVEAEVIVENARIDYITTQLASVRAKPCVWIADGTGTYGSMTIYGFYKDWGINIPYPNISEASITIEGLT